MMRLLAQQGQQQRQHMLRDEPRALGRGVNAVCLNRAGQIVDPRVKHGQKRNMIAGSDLPVHLVKLVDVALPVVGRQGNAGYEDFAVRRKQVSHNNVEILLSGGERKSAQAVIAAKLHNDDRRMQRKNVRQPVDGILRRVAAYPGVDDAVVISAGREVMLKKNRIGLAWVQSVTGGDAVSKADDDSFVSRCRCGTRRADSKTGEQQPEADTATIHALSVATAQQVDIREKR